jgi:hypothetical protein
MVHVPCVSPGHTQLVAPVELNVSQGLAAHAAESGGPGSDVQACGASFQPQVVMYVAVLLGSGLHVLQHVSA